MSWTAKRERDFIKLYNSNLSFSLIAEELGGFGNYPDGGRNACIGKAHRLGLIAREWSEGIKHVQRAPAYQKKPAQRLRKVVAPKPEPVREPWSDKHKVNFLGAGYGQCRWPLWGDNVPIADKFYCGASTNDGSHCWFHSEMAYQPASERKRSAPQHHGRKIGARAA